MKLMLLVYTVFSSFPHQAFLSLIAALGFSCPHAAGAQSKTASIHRRHRRALMPPVRLAYREVPGLGGASLCCDPGCGRMTGHTERTHLAA
jgi:hypothetical protein